MHNRCRPREKGEPIVGVDYDGFPLSRERRDVRESAAEDLCRRPPAAENKSDYRGASLRSG